MNLLCGLSCQGAFGLGGQDWVERHRGGGRLLGGHTALAGVRVGSTGHYEDSIRRRVSRFIGSISAAATPSSQSGVWDWPTSRLEGVAILESVSVSVPPGCRRLVASGCRMISNDPGSRLGRERLRNDGRRCKPVRGENSCAAWTSAVIPRLQEPLLLTTGLIVRVTVVESLLPRTDP